MKTCVICGKSLPVGKIKYCSEACAEEAEWQRKQGLDPKPVTLANGYHKCHTCGRVYNHGDDERFCSKQCRKTYEPPEWAYSNTSERLREGLNRPYTKDTPKLVYLWREQGDSWRLICDILHRSLHNVKQAYELYAEQIGANK